MPPYLHAIVAQVPSVLAILGFRSAPFVASSSFSRSATLMHRALALAAFASCAFVVYALDGPFFEFVVRTPIALGYFALVSLLVHRVGRYTLRMRAGRLLLAGALVTLYVVVPAITVRDPAVTASLLLGWEITFSAYSYVIYTASSATQPELRSCLFFLLVDPTLAYPDRAARRPRPESRVPGLFRIMLGVLALFAQYAITFGVPMLPFVQVCRAPPASELSVLACASVRNASFAFGMYFAHSGLASIRIGWMRLLGYGVSECYRYPFLATSPRSFWERWNIWLGRWVRLHLYLPTARWARRRWRRGAALSAGTTFLTVGLLHDVFAGVNRYCLEGTLVVDARFTTAFALVAALYLLWHPIAGLGRRLRTAATPLRRGALSLLLAALLNLIMWAIAAWVLVG